MYTFTKKDSRLEKYFWLKFLVYLIEINLPNPLLKSRLIIELKTINRKAEVHEIQRYNGFTNRVSSWYLKKMKLRLSLKLSSCKDCNFLN